MVSIIYNDIDPVSRNSHACMVHEYENQEMPFELVKVQAELINATLPESISEPAVFMSKHSSSKSIGSFTVHSEGNWSSKAELGGIPNKLSMASPIEMLNTLIQMSKINVDAVEVTYEATHHGPHTYKRSFFAEVGGNADRYGTFTISYVCLKCGMRKRVKASPKDSAEALEALSSGS